ncbi:MAG: SDR family oxidoreductase [Chloroflexi bacterium]|nr:SDR family oxidoreductase [Chloroflexota bacterium]
MNKPKILITGGSGYLGDWVVRLAHTDWDVTATYLTRPTDEPSATWRRLDLRDEAAVTALVDEVRPTAIIHTAACNPGYSTDFEATNATGTRHIARAAAACGARLIHLSSDVIFDGEKGNYVEQDPPTPISPYGRSKALAESEVHASGAEAVIARTSLIYGWRPHIGKHTSWMIDNLETGQPVRLFTDELRCPIWVESLAAAVIELAGTSYTGVLHIAGAQTLSRHEFGVRLLRFHGIDPSPTIPTLSRKVAPGRSLDCTLDCSRARSLLRTPLPGVDEVLAR